MNTETDLRPLLADAGCGLVHVLLSHLYELLCKCNKKYCIKTYWTLIIMIIKNERHNEYCSVHMQYLFSMFIVIYKGINDFHVHIVKRFIPGQLAGRSSMA